MTVSSKFSTSSVRPHVVCAKCDHIFHQSQIKKFVCVLDPTTKNSTECCAMCATQRNSSLATQDSTGTAVVPHVERHFCNQCPRSFKRPGDLRRHYKKHFTSERHFHCTEQSCDRKGAKGFYRRDKLVDHQKKKHDTVVKGMQNMRHALASSESVNPQSYYFGPNFKGNNLGDSFDGSVSFSPQSDCLDPKLRAIDLAAFDFGSLDSDYTAL